MFNRRVKGLNGLPQQRHTSGEHGAGDHHGNLTALLFEDLADCKQARFHVQRVEACFGQQQIAAAVHKASNLFGVGFDHLIKLKRSATRLVGIHRQLDLRGPDTSCNVARLVRIARRLLVSYRASQLSPDPVDFIRQVRQLEFFQRHDVRVERVRFDDVRASVQILLMDARDQLWLSQHKQVGGVSDINRMVLESLASITGFVRVIGHDQGSHRAVDDQDAFFKQVPDVRSVGGHANSCCGMVVTNRSDASPHNRGAPESYGLTRISGNGHLAVATKMRLFLVISPEYRHQPATSRVEQATTCNPVGYSLRRFRQRTACNPIVVPCH